MINTQTSTDRAAAPFGGKGGQEEKRTRGEDGAEDGYVTIGILQKLKGKIGLTD